MAEKMSPARREMLSDLLDGPKTGAMHYPPNKWALEQGYATKRDGKYGAIIFEITPAGRRALCTRDGGKDA